MSFLSALIAFAAVITIYSTVVTIIVEGIHKIFGMRSAGMNEIVRAFYDNTLGHLQPANTEEEQKAPVTEKTPASSQRSKAFANAFCRRSPSESLRPWYLRNWPIIGSWVASRQKKMTTLQFIERLAETPEGAALERHSREDLRKALSSAAYQYERLGESQSQYFQSRASLLSVLAGILVAVFVNLDSISLFHGLTKNTELSSRVALTLEHERLETLQGLAVSPENITEAAYGEIGSDLLALTGDVRTLGLPIGRKMFPHCEGYFKEEADASTTAPSPDADYIDPRCSGSKQELANQTWARSFSEYQDEWGTKGAGLLTPVVDRTGYTAQRIAAIGKNPETFLLWALGILVSGGLIGLGAPFWFGIFKRLTTYASPVAGFMRTPNAGQAPSQPQKRDVPGLGIRPIEASTPEELERGFLTVLGAQSGSRYLDDLEAEQADFETAEPGTRIGDRPDGFAEV